MHLKSNAYVLTCLWQRWNKHYCVISEDKLYYAEEYEEEEDDPRKVKTRKNNNA